MAPLRVALVGDYQPESVAHRAIRPALEIAGESSGVPVGAVWVPTESIDARRPRLERFDGVWAVPATPYRDQAGAIGAIRFARERGVPFLGTCGGFQHAVLEVAEALWGVASPAHAETDVDARDPIIAPLACALVEVGGRVRFAPGSKLATAYGRLDAHEEYHCSYGLGPRCLSHLAAAPLRATAWSDDGDVRGVELDGHPFFVGTLFQSERAALRGAVPPIARAFVAAMLARVPA